MVFEADVYGIKMKYAKFGEGDRNFVVIPGLSIKAVTDSEQALVRAFSSFCDEFTVYVFDRRSNPPEDYSVDMMADDTVVVLKSIGVEKASFFGASQGGMIIQKIAINYPEIPEKIVLGSSISRGNETSSEAIEKWVELAESKNQKALFESTVELIYCERIAKVMKNMFGASFEITDEELKNFIIMAKACLTFSAYDDLEKITCPAFVIGCEGDRVVTAEASEKLAEKLNCELYMYGKEYGHGVYDEAPDYRQRIFDFIK